MIDTAKLIPRIAPGAFTRTIITLVASVSVTGVVVVPMAINARAAMGQVEPVVVDADTVDERPPAGPREQTTDERADAPRSRRAGDSAPSVDEAPEVALGAETTRPDDGDSSDGATPSSSSPSSATTAETTGSTLQASTTLPSTTASTKPRPTSADRPSGAGPKTDDAPSPPAPVDPTPSTGEALPTSPRVVTTTIPRSTTTPASDPAPSSTASTSTSLGDTNEPSQPVEPVIEPDQGGTNQPEPGPDGDSGLVADPPVFDPEPDPIPVDEGPPSIIIEIGEDVFVEAVLPEDTDGCFTLLAVVYPFDVADIGIGGDLSLGYCRNLLHSLITSGQVLVIVDVETSTVRLIEAEEADGLPGGTNPPVVSPGSEPGSAAPGGGVHGRPTERPEDVPVGAEPEQMPVVAMPPGPGADPNEP